MTRVKFLLLTFLFFYGVIDAQDFSKNWKGHFSYLDIKAITHNNSKIYAASDNAIFSYDLDTNEISEISTINGLSGDDISTIAYYDLNNLLIVGYETGLIEIAFEDNSEVISVIDIVNKTTIAPDRKRINHFTIDNGFLYISTNFGISLFDLDKFEFGDTYFIGNGGSQIQVNQTAIFDNHIYAATFDSGGIKKASLNNSQLVNFSQWTTIRSGNWKFIQTVNNSMFAIQDNDAVYKISDSDFFTFLENYTESPTKVTGSENELLIITDKTVNVYDEDYNPTSIVNQNSINTAPFSCAILLDSRDLFVGTKNIINEGESGNGVLKITLDDPSSFVEIHPKGPLLNSSFSIELKNQNLWCAHGGYSFNYNFNGGIRKSGISNYSYNDDAWNNIVYDSIANKVNNPNYLSHISINPNNTNQVYVSSYFSGLIEILDNKIASIYNQDNSTITPFVGAIHPTLTSKYDENGALWITNGRVNRPLNKFMNNQWQSYDLSSAIPEPEKNLGFSSISFESSENIFIGTYLHGFVGFNENGGTPLVKSISSAEENMPSDYVKSLATDKRNNLWIGTLNGLRVLYNTSGFFDDDNVRVEEIIIEEDGIAKELLFQQFITDIEVDGSNNKWIGTADSGLFFFSPDGQNTIFHFTKENSPLPSNTINDVSLDDLNGIVYIATSKGLVSFLSGGSSPIENLESSYAYPNPVRPGFNIVDEKVKIKDISENVNIKITDIEGNLVAEAQSRVNQRYRGFNLEIDGGTAYWNGKNLANNIVASGVYLVMLSDLDTLETKVIKLMVVR